jgi:hypothetical protein
MTGRGRSYRSRNDGRDDLRIRVSERRTLLVVELTENLADDLPHALQRLEIVLCLVERLLRLLHLVAEPPDLSVELLRWSKNARFEAASACPGAGSDPTGRHVGERARATGRVGTAMNTSSRAYLVLQHQLPIFVDRRRLGVDIARHDNPARDVPS